MHHLPDQVAELAELMKALGLTEAELSGDGWRIAIKKGGVTGPATLSPTPLPHDEIHEELEPEEEEQEGEPVTSPMAGIFYGSPSPSAPPFVMEGESVEEGQVVGLIEAMKVFNEILAPRAGIVRKVSAKSGELVGAGEALLWIA